MSRSLWRRAGPGGGATPAAARLSAPAAGTAGAAPAPPLLAAQEKDDGGHAEGQQPQDHPVGNAHKKHLPREISG